jgi:hypothetical protein
MTLVKRGALAGLQVYLPGAVSQWTRKQLIIRNPPPWALGVENLSGPQLSACYALAMAASQFGFGEGGKVKYKGLNLPIVAAIVAQAVPKGEGVHGGIPKSERARRKHEMFEVTRAYLESLMEAKGVARPTITTPTIVRGVVPGVRKGGG